MSRRKIAGALVFCATVGAAASVGTIEPISVTPLGVVGNGASEDADVSADGRFVVYDSLATNLVLSPTTTRQVFLRDRQSTTTEVVSKSTAGVLGDAMSFAPRVSGDGRFVVFYSIAANLVAGDGNGKSDVFLRDRDLGTTERISVSATGGDADDSSLDPCVSDDGRFVAFVSDATNLAENSIPGQSDVFVRDRVTGTTERISHALSGAPDGFAMQPSISADGRYVAFTSQATNLVTKDKNVKRDVFVYDRVAHRTELVSVSSKSKQGNGESSAARISADGRFVVFQSYSSNFGLKLTNFQIGDFLRDRALNRLEPVSLTNAGALPFGSAYQPTVSAGGRLVAFQCQGLTIADPPSGQLAAYVRDRQARTTERASGTATGFGLDAVAGPANLSRDGGTVVFLSRSTQLAADDTNAASDVFASEMTFPPDAPAPVADAGPDQDVVATGKKTKVTLDASSSTDPANSPLKFAWFENGRKVAAGAQPKLKLTVGAHSIWLVATNKKKLVGADEVLVIVTP